MTRITVHFSRIGVHPTGIAVHAARIIMNALIFHAISLFHSRERYMPNKRIVMRKIHEILRLRFEVGLSFRQISQCADACTGLEASGISCRSLCYILSLTVAPARWRILTGLKSIWSCVRKASPATFCQRVPFRAYSYSQFCCR